VRVNAMPKATYFPKQEKLDVSMYMLGWGGSITDPEPTFTQIYRNRGTGGIGEYNRGNFKDDELDALVAASSKELDPEKRKALIKKAMLRHNEQCPPHPAARQYHPLGRAQERHGRATVRTTGSSCNGSASSDGRSFEMSRVPPAERPLSVAVAHRARWAVARGDGKSHPCFAVGDAAPQ
jgi:ABC-type transport system substrate-binding protein